MSACHADDSDSNSDLGVPFCLILMNNMRHLIYTSHTSPKEELYKPVAAFRDK